MRPDELLSILRPHGLVATSAWENELLLELLFWVVVLLVTLALLIFRPAILKRAELFWKRISQKQGLAVLVTVLAALMLRLALLLVLPIPDPVVHDEYSYLLQGETFASGRLTNPTPAMWVHFETFHVNMRPSYQSMYPPAQGVVLATAVALGLQPWWAVWLSVGLLCGAVCWMLQGWMPPHWAFLGGMFCVIRFATFSYWINSYWGGAVAAAGGALVLGALPRIRRDPGIGYGLAFAAGLALLANSRPYEGFVFSITATLSLLLWLIGVGRKKPVRIAVFVPALILLAAVGAGMAYYNWRSTGNPMDMPYAENHRQYHITNPLIWQKRNPIPEYHHQVMRKMYVYHELPDALNRHYADGLWNILTLKFRVYYDFFVWPLLFLMVFACWAMAKSRRMRLIPITVLVLFVGLLVEQWPPHGHYAAPFLSAVLAMILYGLRLARTWKPRGIPFGPMLTRAIILTCACWTAVPLGALIINPWMIGRYSDMPPTLDRSRIIAQLEKEDGKHLVLVHNRRTAQGIFDWVYNEPDIDHAKIIWARDMDEKENQELIRYYPDRHVWIVDQDDGVMQLQPYQRNQDDLDPARILHVATNQPVAAGR